jgi:signal transduction histidine kinase
VVIPETTPVTDITPQADVDSALQSAQVQLDHLKDQLTESQRLATLGTIAAVIAHEFNNLLTPIISYSQYALSGIEKGKPDMALIEKALRKSFQHAEKAGKTCTSMLALARGEGDVATLPVHELVEQTLSILTRDPRKDGIALRVQIQPDAVIQGDPVQLEQVLLNLLINARQAIVMSNTSRGSSITIRAERDAEVVRLAITDTGPGIAPENLTRIFEPFFTTKKSTDKDQVKGTGLGLAICKQVIERHKGTIAVDSTVGKGTTFTLTLPAA